MPDLWAVPAQERAAATLRAAVAREQVPNAWAFAGPPGVGQQEAGRALAAALNCPQATGGQPCGSCDVCARCARGVYPALWELAPTGREHRVADVRDVWLHAAARSAVEGIWKVLHVAEADRMNDAAANAFLKGLEEPPAGTVWLLDVADPDELPDTILSRCREVRFAPWSSAELDLEARRLGLDDPGERALAVRAALGQPARLHRLAEAGLDDLRAHRSILARLRVEGPGYAVVAARALDAEVKRRTATLKAQSKAERERLAGFYGDEMPRGVARQLDDRLTRQERETRTSVVQAALDDLLAWLRDALLVNAGGDVAAAIHADDADGLRADAQALGPAGLLRACDLVAATRADTELNVAQQLALEALFLDLSVVALEAAR